ncbi:MAG: hypothetical protein H7Y88_02150 [Phycisphaerales bacterium]|nr:hypothetical protein [Phycisphaerales bacterium]
MKLEERGQKILMYVVIAVLVISVGWIAYFATRSGRSLEVAPRDDKSPANLAAMALREKLVLEEPFRRLGVHRSPEDPKTLVVGGDVEFSEDIEALKAWLQENPVAGYQIRLEVEAFGD